MSGDQAEFQDIELVQRSLEGEEEAVRALQEAHGPFLRGVLISYGAMEAESEEILACLWADCLTGRADRLPLFHRYDGRSSLRPWLAAIAVNRWISSKRRDTVQARTLTQFVASWEPDEGAEMIDTALMEIAGQALRSAFEACDAEEIVMLQLVHVHRLTRREVAALWGCHESGVGRRVKSAEEKIAGATLQSIKAADPFLNLKWSDFLALCESANVLRS